MVRSAFWSGGQMGLQVLIRGRRCRRPGPQGRTATILTTRASRESSTVGLARSGCDDADGGSDVSRFENDQLPSWVDAVTDWEPLPGHTRRRGHLYRSATLLWEATRRSLDRQPAEKVRAHRGRQRTIQSQATFDRTRRNPHGDRTDGQTSGPPRGGSHSSIHPHVERSATSSSHGTKPQRHAARCLWSRS